MLPLPPGFPTGWLPTLPHLLLLPFRRFVCAYFCFCASLLVLFSFITCLTQSSLPPCLGPLSVSLFQASMLFPLRPRFSHPPLLPHASYTSALHPAHQQLLPFLPACLATSIISLQGFITSSYKLQHRHRMGHSLEVPGPTALH